MREIAAELGKEVIASRDRPGFIVNRVLMPFLGEAMRALKRAWRAPKTSTTALASA